VSTSGWEQGKEVIESERKPVLYDAKGHPLVRATGFRSRPAPSPQVVVSMSFEAIRDTTPGVTVRVESERA